MEGQRITQFLLEHAGIEPASFHMPGHKGAKLYREYGYDMFLEHIMDCDITEICGADNLFKADGIIRETAERYRKLYDVKNSYLLVNGTSCGIIAAILSSVRPGGRLIMARNCHKSVFNALSLGNIEPVYAYPQMAGNYGISGEVTAEEIARCLDEAPDADAVILPSPNYYGICSDIERIAQAVHDRNKVLIIDQAHGAHLKLFEKFCGNIMPELPCSAETGGADIVINSIHKTLASFTQSAVLNVNSDAVELPVLEDKLQALESSSPSYILMASLDINAELIEEHGRELFSRWQENLQYFYREADKIEGLRIMKLPGQMDMTKINLDMSSCGISGAELEKLLMEKGIFSELVTGDILMCMTGIGNRFEDFRRLSQALKRIASSAMCAADQKGHMDMESRQAESSIWTKKRKLYDAFGVKRLIKLDESAGMICAGSVIPYPPGIPLLCPGERIETDDIEYIDSLVRNGETVLGINENGEILSYLTVNPDSNDI